MNKLKLLGGGAVVTSTVLLATAGAFAAAPNGLLQPGHGPTDPSLAAHGQLTRMHHMGRFVRVRDAMAQLLGLTPEQLKSELQTKTLDQLAAEHGMTRAELMQQALKNAGFSEVQIQKIMNAMAKIPHDRGGLLRVQ